MAAKTMKEILDTAYGIYEKAECAAGCCGDFKGALEYIDGAVGELVQAMVNIAVDRDLVDGLFRVGLNPLGNVVMLCEVCDETFEKKIQGKTLSELYRLRAAHKCKKPLEGN